METEETKQKGKLRQWACGFDIRDPANWPKVVEKLKANDKAILEDFGVYFKGMLETVDNFARPKILKRFDKKLFRTAWYGYGLFFKDRTSKLSDLYLEFADYYMALQECFWNSFRRNVIKIDYIESLGHFGNRLEIIFFNRVIDDIVRSNKRDIVSKRTVPVGDDFIQNIFDNSKVKVRKMIVSEAVVRELLNSVFVERILRKISKSSREIIRLRLFDDATLKEIKEKLGWSVPTVIKRLNKNLEHLKEVYKNEG
jgi:hypothetical protein